jgi:hypothetical protein
MSGTREASENKEWSVLKMQCSGSTSKQRINTVQSMLQNQTTLDTIEEQENF